MRLSAASDRRGYCHAAVASVYEACLFFSSIVVSSSKGTSSRPPRRTALPGLNSLPLAQTTSPSFEKSLPESVNSIDLSPRRLHQPEYPGHASEDSKVWSLRRVRDLEHDSIHIAPAGNSRDPVQVPTNFDSAALSESEGA